MATKDFFELVKAIGESKSKQEEDRIVLDELAFLKKSFSVTSLPKKKVKELIIRALYVEMLGQDASFAYIKVVELCASTNILQKRVGYLAAALCFSPDHEFRFMLVNQIQRDMNSINQLDVSAALSAVCKIVTEDMIPAVIGDVVKLLTHDMDNIRKKAICAMHRLYQMDHACITEYIDKIRRILCDKDPSVMGASLPLLLDLAKESPADYKDLVPSLVSIIKQITDHRLPKDFDYHRIPAPWIQMALLKLFAVLGRGDQASSEGMYEVLVDVMRRADTGINVGYAIVYEAVITVTTIYPNPLLLDAAATAISRFIRSDSNNLKYIGIKGLASIVKDHPKYAVDHQMAVIDCLEDQDETLKRKTLDLLFRMTNAVNVEFIVDRLLTSLASAVDDHFRTDLVGQITQCAERFAPSNAWYVRTMVKVFELAGDKVKMSVAQTLMQLIAEGSADENHDEDGREDDELRAEAVEDFLGLLDKQNLPSILAQSMVWILGEYGYLSKTQSKEGIMDKLCNLCDDVDDDSTRAHIITALMKLVAQNGSCPPKVTQVITLYKSSRSIEVQQRCYEFEALLSHSGIMADVLPVDASCEDIDVDEELKFLDGYVQQALLKGAIPYSPPVDWDDTEEVRGKDPVLKTGAYEKPQIPQTISLMPMLVQAGVNPASITSLPGNIPVTAPTLGLTSQGNQLLNYRTGSQVWGKKMDPVVTSVPITPHQETSASTSTNTVTSQVVPVSASVTTSPAISVPPPMSEQAMREKSEKEKMAAALFGGMTGSARPVTGSGGSSTGNKNKNKPTAITSPFSPSNNPISPSQASASVISENTMPSANSNLFDMLEVSIHANNNPSNGNNGDTSSTHASGVSTQPPAVISSSFLDMMPVETLQPTASASIVSVKTNLPSLTPTPIQPAANRKQLLTDAFADMNSVTLQPSKPSNSGGYSGVSTASLNATLVGLYPLKLSTAEFGQKWGQLPSEVKGSFSAPLITSLELLKNTVPTTYYLVESIPATSEAIFAASTVTGGVILVHIKLQLHRKGCDLIVKSSTKQICGEQLTTLSNLLSSQDRFQF